MSEAKSIKETVELLEGLKLVAVQSKKVMADGKIDVKDFPVLLDTMKQAGVLSTAVAGSNEIPAEVKDLSQEEAKALLAKVFEIVAALKVA